MLIEHREPYKTTIAKSLTPTPPMASQVVAMTMHSVTSDDKADKSMITCVEFEMKK